MGKQLRKYTYDMKKKVVNMYYEGHSVSDLVIRFDISNRRRINDWVQKVREGGYDALKDRRGVKSKGRPQKDGLTLKEENERLRLEVMYLKKLIDLQRG